MSDGFNSDRKIIANRDFNLKDTLNSLNNIKGICDKHEQESSIFCFDCNNGICSYCKKSYHSSHITTSKASYQISTKISKYIFSDVSSQIAKVFKENNKQALNNYFTNLINQRFDELKFDLEKLRKDKLKEINALFSSQDNFSENLIRDSQETQASFSKFVDQYKDFFPNGLVYDAVFIQIYDLVTTGVNSKEKVESFLNEIINYKNNYEEYLNNYCNKYKEMITKLNSEIFSNSISKIDGEGFFSQFNDKIKDNAKFIDLYKIELSNYNKLITDKKTNRTKILTNNKKKTSNTSIVTSKNPLVTLNSKNNFIISSYIHCYIQYINNGIVKIDSSLLEQIKSKLFKSRNINQLLSPQLSGETKNPISNNFLNLIDKQIKNTQIIDDGKDFIKPIEGTNEIQLFDFKNKFPYKIMINLSKFQHEYQVFPEGVRSITIKNKMYIFGGIDMFQEYKTVLKFEIETKKLSRLQNLYNSRSFHSLIYNEEDDSIYIIGGENNRTCERFQIDNEKIYSLPNLRFSRANPTLFIYKSTYLFAFCGYKSEIYKNDLNDTVEMIIICDSSSNNEIIHDVQEDEFWEKVEFKNSAGIDLKYEYIGILQVTEDFVFLYGGYDPRRSTRSISVLNMMKKEIMPFNEKVLEQVKKAISADEKFNELFD